MLSVIDKFRFHCHKILPLVYDESLSYYEVLCKVANKLNDVIQNNNELLDEWTRFEAQFGTNLIDVVRKVLEEMRDDGEFADILEQILNAPKLVNKLSMTLYGQLFPFSEDTVNWASSGMCVAERNGIEYIITCFKDSEDANQIVKINRLDNGDLIASKSFNNLGHANGCAYDKEKDLIYIAPGGDGKGRNYIVALKWDLIVDSTHVMDGYVPYGVAVVKNRIYVLSSGPVIVTLDKDFNKLNEVGVRGVEDAVSQSLAADENFFYIPYGRHSTRFDGVKVMFESIAVYRHDGTFYKLVFADTTTEIEAMAFYSGGVILSCATLRRELIFKSSIYEIDKVFHTDTDNWNNKITFSTNTQKLYVDETYVGYRCDGSSTYPLGDFRLIGGQVWDYATVFDIYCLSDISYPISVKVTNRDIYIHGNNHKFAGVYFGNNNKVRLVDMEIVSKSSTADGLVVLENCKTVELYRVTFSGTDASYCVDNIGCNVYLNNCHVSADPIKAVLYGRRGGTYRLQEFTQSSDVTLGSELYSSDNYFDSASLIPCVYGVYNHSAFQCNNLSLNGEQHNGKSVFDFRLCGVYNVPASTVVLLDKPTSGGTYMVGLKVENINNTHLKYTAYMTNDYIDYTEMYSYLSLESGNHSNWV